MIYEILGIGALLFAALAVLLFLERQGRKAEQNDQMKRVLDDVHTAALARDRLRHDTDAAKRVRDRFTR